jgi:hypothetical protein
MTFLLTCVSIFTDEERMCAAAVNLGSGLRPLPRNRKEAEASPYDDEWRWAMASECGTHISMC